MTSGPKYGALAIRKGRLCGADGGVVVLRGMSLFWSQWGGRFYTEKTVNRLVDDWSVDVIRVALAVEPDAFLVNPDIELSRICMVIEAAITRKIYVIVDWHSHNAHTAAAVEAFSKLGRRYGRNSNMIWEIWNEPADGLLWERDILPHHLQVIDALRRSGAHGLAICGTPRYCQDFSAVIANPIRRPNIAYALHFYAGSHGSALRAAVEHALVAGVCIFASEYGLGEADGDGRLAHEEIVRWWRFLEEWQISHVNWSLFDKAETCAALRRTTWYGQWVLSPSGQIVRAMLRSQSQR